MSAPTEGIRAVGLHKRYGPVVAVDSIDLEVAPGEIVGVLGPNGAGKTSTINMLTTLLPIDGGHARVAGFDVATQPHEARERIGVVAQTTTVDERLSAEANLDLFARCHHLPAAERTEVCRRLLARIDLGDAAQRPASSLSGGQRRRLDLAAALVGSPDVLFLDEPTTGLDIGSRRALWDDVRALRDAGTAVLLTTQYLEEADRVCDRVVFVDHGRVIASGEMADLKRSMKQDVLHVDLDTPAAARRAASTLGVDAPADGTTALTVRVADGRAAYDVLATLDRAGVAASDFRLRGPTLDDVFLSLTGSARTDAAPARPTRSLT